MGAAKQVRTAVAIMAKAPEAGRVKTRLCPPLGADEAVELYRSFLLDTIGAVASLGGITPAVSYAPAEAREFFAAACPGFLLVSQRGPDLGARLARTFGDLFALGFDAALAIGADSPTLPRAFLRQGVALLGDPRVDVVLGPSEDGGYYLIGLSAPRPELFRGVAWSTARVFGETLERAEAAGLAVRCLPPWYDVDTVEDLARLEVSLRGPEGLAARHTRHHLAARASQSP